MNQEAAEKASRHDWEDFYDSEYASKLEIIDDIEEETPPVDVEAAMRKRRDDIFRSMC